MLRSKASYEISGRTARGRESRLCNLILLPDKDVVPRSREKSDGRVAPLQAAVGRNVPPSVSRLHLSSCTEGFIPSPLPRLFLTPQKYLRCAPLFSLLPSFSLLLLSVSGQTSRWLLPCSSRSAILIRIIIYPFSVAHLFLVWTTVPAREPHMGSDQRPLRCCHCLFRQPMRRPHVCRPCVSGFGVFANLTKLGSSVELGDNFTSNSFTWSKVNITANTQVMISVLDVNDGEAWSGAVGHGNVFLSIQWLIFLSRLPSSQATTRPA